MNTLCHTSGINLRLMFQLGSFAHPQFEQDVSFPDKQSLCLKWCYPAGSQFKGCDLRVRIQFIAGQFVHRGFAVVKRHKELARQNLMAGFQPRRYLPLPGGNLYLRAIFQADPFDIIRVNEHVGSVGEVSEHFVASGHGAGMVLVENSAGVEQEGVVVIWFFGLRHIGHRVQPGPAARRVEPI